MSIQLVKSEDCKRDRQKRKYSTIEIKEEQLEQDQKSGFLQLIDKKDCSTSAKLTAEKMTKHELGYKIRTGDIDIPKWDKRYSCEYYTKENRSCSVYPKRHCFNCKKKNIQKMTQNEK